MKNRYIARTFIMPGQAMRRRTVRLKLNCIKAEFAGKTVLLVDDSIVRGTTAVELVQMARDAGAKRVYFASAAPPVGHPNVYGIDIPTRRELVAHGRSMEEIRQYLRADRYYCVTILLRPELRNAIISTHVITLCIVTFAQTVLQHPGGHRGGGAQPEPRRAVHLRRQLLQRPVRDLRGD